jgi:hypothetical protein
MVVFRARCRARVGFRFSPITSLFRATVDPLPVMVDGPRSAIPLRGAFFPSVGI